MWCTECQNVGPNVVQMWSKCGPNALYLHVSQCVHFYCLPVAEDHNDCKTCKSDSTCGWAFNKGCFDLASGITGVSNKGKKASKHQQNKTHPPHTPSTPFNIFVLTLSFSFPVFQVLAWIQTHPHRALVQMVKPVMVPRTCLILHRPAQQATVAMA
jgi:hypothetical protein